MTIMTMNGCLSVLDQCVSDTLTSMCLLRVYQAVFLKPLARKECGSLGSLFVCGSLCVLPMGLYRYTSLLLVS